jgi:hypothetical protein
VESALPSDQPLAPRRTFALVLALATLAAISGWFYYRQNFAGQIGGEMSIAKLLWLDYAIIAWFILPFFLWRSPLIASNLRRIYAIHLVNFSFRGVIELWMMYVTFSWMPPYGIGHDLFSIAILTGLRRSVSGKPAPVRDPANQAALSFLTSIRLTLLCEMAFAWLFYRSRADTGLYFASADPSFALINRLTWIVVIFAYADLARILWAARKVLCLPVSDPPSEGQGHV